jgi:hypothetical protein
MHNQTYDPQSVGFDMSNQQEQFPQDTWESIYSIT